MKIYFLSSTPCALTLNGVFFGLTDAFERSAELSLSDRVYAQFSPEGAQPLGCFLTESLPSDPPAGFEVYLLREGIALYARDFPPADFTLRPVTQKREGDTLVTVFFQGNLQLSIDSPLGFFNATLPPSFASSRVIFHGELILLHGEQTISVFTRECKCLLQEKVCEYRLSENSLWAILPLSDRLQRTAECEWSLKENACTLTSFTLRSPTANPNQPPADLLAYAFFESVLIKADYEKFLSDELLADKERLLSFLGDFLAVVLTDNPAECGLVRKKEDRLFVVDYFTVDVENGKIVDVRG